jgi:hypothetical protein
VTPMEIYEDMFTRCQDVILVTGDRETFEFGAEAVGVMMRLPEAETLAVEFGQAPDGSSFVTATVYSAEGVKRRPSLLELDDTIMITMDKRP